MSVPLIAKERIDTVTADIVDVVFHDVDDGLHIDSIDAVAMLSSVVVNESGLKEAVEACKVSGDKGKSIGLGQVMIGKNWEGHTRSEICADRKLQLKLVLHVLDRCWLRTQNAGAVFRCYTAGDAAIKSAIAEAEFKTYSRVVTALKSKNN
jgi:hypothetical protein